jgi:hypothetical protein
VKVETIAALRLPYSTGECDVGPVIEHRPGQLIVRYDAESDGGPVWTSIEFMMVVALRFTLDPSCVAWMVSAYSQVREVVDSPWKRELRELAATNRVLLSASARHFVVYFDHIGCWEVLADDVRLNN